MAEKVTNDVLAERLAGMGADINRRFEETARTLVEIKDNLKNEYVTRKEFEPVRYVVYGLVGIVLSGAVAAVLQIIYRA